jgi:hypothetical protein
MNAVEMLGSAMGLGLLAGIRLYATVFFLGLAIRFGWFHLHSALSHLSLLSETPVLALSGIACLIEFLADKIPWIDSLWDSVHTFIRPIGAAALGATALGSFDPATKFMVALLCGGVAFTGHTSKAATRLAVNHSPEPVSNWAVSFAEDLMVPAGLWVIFQYPAVALAIVSVVVAIFFWLSPRLFRLLHVSWVAFRSVMRRWFSITPPATPPPIPPDSELPPQARSIVSGLPFQPVSDEVARKLQGVRTGVHCVPMRGVRRLKNSTGYLCILPDQLVFIAKRMFRLRTIEIPMKAIHSIRFDSGIFLDRLFMETEKQQLAFDVFK